MTNWLVGRSGVRGWVLLFAGRGSRAGVSVGALTTVLGVIALAGCGGSTNQRTVTVRAPTRAVTRLRSSSPSDPLARLVRKVRSSVIRIETNACGVQEVGTGFLIGSRLIATVEHVVDGASSISLKQGDTIVASGTVVGEDQERDVALVRSSAPVAGRVLRLGTRAPQLGEPVATLGFPLGLPLTVTQGSVSGLGRSIPIDGINRRGMVQTDAAVNPGNSGGPLLSVGDGEVVGLVDLGTNFANGIGFAVSAQVAQPLLQAWTAAPQPVPTAACAGSQPSPVADSPSDSGGPDTASAGPADTLQTHLQDLDSGQYQEAFSLMSAAYQSQNPSWVQERTAADPGITIITVGTPTYGGDTASVPVDFYARDRHPTAGSDTKCREFKGIASLIQENGVWRYDPGGNQLSASAVPSGNPNCP